MLKEKEAAVYFYKLLKALFILSTGAEEQYKFNLKINKEAGIDFFFEQEKIEYIKLPNFINNDIQAIVMADVSGSMYTKPMASSVGLGIYFAEHNQGAYHNLLMTFSENPRFINLDGLDTLYDKCNHKDCDKPFCLRKYKLDCLYNEALLSMSQRKHITLKVDEQTINKREDERENVSIKYIRHKCQSKRNI